MEISTYKLKKINKIKDTINLILAMFITLSPLLTIFINALDEEILLHILFQWFGYAYLIFLPFLIVCICLQKGFWQKTLDKLKKLPVILTLALWGWIMLSCMVTNSFNIFLMYFIIYMCIFICVITLDEKYEGLIVNTLICTMAVSCLLGMLDPTGRFMPGFDIKTYPLSMQFYNPNYTGYVMALVGILNTWIMCTTKDKKQLAISIFAYVLLNIYLFMNGSFAPITFVFFTLLVMILYFWIKEKKCPVKLIISFLAMIPMAFLVDLIPDINKYRTCDYNYFLECVAVVDNYLGTDMLSWFGISEIIGSDGWDRGARQEAAWAEILSNFKTFFFGNGSGGNFKFLPHNTFLCLWLNYGIIATLLYYSINIYLLVRFLQIKNNTHLIGYVGSCLGYVLMMFTGDLIEYSFCFHMIVLAFTFFKVEKAYAEQLKEQQDEKIKKFLEEEEARKKAKKTHTKKTTTRKPSSSGTTRKKATSSSVKKSTTSSSTTRRAKNKTEESFINKENELVIDFNKTE